jgi:hypothetical protein
VVAFDHKQLWWTGENIGAVLGTCWCSMVLLHMLGPGDKFTVGAFTTSSCGGRVSHHHWLQHRRALWCLTRNSCGQQTENIVLLVVGTC